MILVTGASGGLGTAIINVLLETLPANQIGALVRNPEKSASLQEKDIQIFVSDYNNQKTLVKAFTGVDKLVFVSGNDETDERISQHRNVINAAVEAKINHVYYTSFSNPVENSKFTFTKAHAVTERYIEKSGLNYTFLRNSFYAEILLPAARNAYQTGKLTTAAPYGKTPFIPRFELAAAIAAIVTSNQHPPRAVELTGSRLYSYSDIAELISLTTGKNISLDIITTEEFKEVYLSMQMPEFLAEGLASIFDAIEAREYEFISDDFKKYTGRDPMDLKVFLEASKSFILE